MASPAGIDRLHVAASSLTRVIGIVEGRGEHLERTGKVQEVELGVQGEQNIDRFVSHCGRLGCHLDDWYGLCVGSLLKGVGGLVSE